METYEVPENQLTIFDMFQDSEEKKTELFLEENAKWHQENRWIKYMPNDWVCGVVGIIPVAVRSPLDQERKGEKFSNEWHDQQSIWRDYVYSVSQLIPYHQRGEEDVNGWTAACEMLEEARDSKRPIELIIWKYNAESFKELQVIEYLDKRKSEDEINETT